MDIFEKIDCWLIDQLEVLTHRFQRITGKDCFWMAEVCTSLIFGIWFCFIEYQILISSWDFIDILVNILLLVLSCGGLFFLVYHAKTQTRKHIQFKNSKRHDTTSRSVRILWLVISLLNLWALCAGKHQHLFGKINCISSLITTLLMYLIACTPLPPRKSLIKKLLEAILDAFNRGREAIPDPVPS